MQQRYNKKLNMPLSPLGFGVMRLQQNPDGSFPQKVHSLLAEAYEKGVNYFDTAYVYLGGNSETLIRDALVKKYPRESFYIADKLPVWDCKDRDDMEQAFSIQLERLGVDYIDFYLLHGLHRQRWLDIYNAGALEFLEEKRREGRIRKVGFSMHDTVDTLKIIKNAYEWDFVLLQINYYDWITQRAKENYDYLAEHDIPCMVMGPVGGSRLSKLPNAANEIFNKVNPNFSSSQWALRFVAALPNVAVTLSGMSTIEQLNENIEVFNDLSPLSNEELEALDRVVKVIQSKKPLPCTVCRYCVDDCPKGINIPDILQRFNDCTMFDNADRFDTQYFASIPKDKRGNSCIFCGKCKKKCPQNIDIPKELQKIHNVAISLTIGFEIEKLRDMGKIVLFGGGVDGRRTLAMLRSAGIDVRYFCDNNPQLWGSSIDDIEVINPQKLQGLNATVLITSNKYHDAIKTQLDEMGISIHHKTR
jgi:predicted aldo/keto reductase-like oxidoreductase